MALYTCAFEHMRTCACVRACVHFEFMCDHVCQHICVCMPTRACRVHAQRMCACPRARLCACMKAGHARAVTNEGKYAHVRAIKRVWACEHVTCVYAHSARTHRQPRTRMHPRADTRTREHACGVRTLACASARPNPRRQARTHAPAYITCMPCLHAMPAFLHAMPACLHACSPASEGEGNGRTHQPLRLRAAQDLEGQPKKRRSLRELCLHVCMPACHACVPAKNDTNWENHFAAFLAFVQQ